MKAPYLAAGLVALGLTTAAQAGPMKGEAELGIVMVSGNSESESLSGKVSLEKDMGKWLHSGSLQGTNASSNNVRSTERYLANAKSDYKFTENDYLFIALSYEDDRFSGYDYRATESVGYGRRLIATDTLTLNAEIGAGARQSKLDSGASENEGIVRGNGKLAWNISDTSTFTQELLVESGDSATISKSITGLKVQVAGSLAMKLGYTAKYTSEVPAGIEKTDTETTVTLVYGF